MAAERRLAGERLFVALALPAEICSRLVDFVAALQPTTAARFLPAESYHITLKFIGESQRRAEIVSQLQTIRRDSFAYAIANVGFFPNARAPRIFWAGVEQPVGQTALQALASEVDRSLAAIGIKPDEKPFRPHLTIARPGSGDPHRRSAGGDDGLKQIARAIDGRPQPLFGETTAAEFLLYSSHLGPRGAQYSALERFALS
jgi:RNA 2',3'-cyclic 3'-phosphodiesterase